jgi:hypothetical protein
MDRDQTSGSDYQANIFLKTLISTVLCSAVVPDPDPHGSAFILVGWIRIQEGQNNPQKRRKFKFRGARCSLLRNEDFTCSLEVLDGGLRIS